MKVIIDTNIFIDVMLDRKPLAESSACVLKACENCAVQGLLSASCVTDIFYIIRKYSHSAEKAYSAIGNILEIAGIIPVKESVIPATTPEDFLKFNLSIRWLYIWQREYHGTNTKRLY